MEFVSADCAETYEKVGRLSSKGVAFGFPFGYNVGMKNSNGNNGSTTRTNNARKGTRGPRPIQTVAQLRENLLRDAVAKEMKKIDRKIAVEERKRSVAQKRVNASNNTLADLTRIRAEFLAESGIKA